MKNEIKNMPLISIIVPVYNVEKYLKRCFDSIKKQTYTNIEIRWLAGLQWKIV